MDEPERILLHDTLSPTENEKEENLSPTEKDKNRPPAKSDNPPPVENFASPMHTPQLQSTILTSILETVQKLSQRMDRLEGETPEETPENEVIRMKGKRKAESGSEKREKRPKPTASTASMDETEWNRPSTSHTVTTEADIEEEEEEEDIFHDLAASFEGEEEWGPPVSEKLADLLEKRLGNKLPDRKLQEKLAAYRIPANCRKSMGVPKTNPEVFGAIPPHARKGDVRMRHNQLTLTKAAVAMTSCTNRLLELRDSLSSSDPKASETSAGALKSRVTECIGNLADALALTGHVSRDLSQKRRDMHRPHLPSEISGICAPHTPMTGEWLYPEGSEFHRSLKEAREARKLGQDMRGQGSRRGQGQNWHRGNSHSSGFLYRQASWKGNNSRNAWNQSKRGKGQGFKHRN